MKSKVILSLLIFLLSSCAYLDPVMQELNVISVPEEQKIGDQIAQQVAQEMKLATDPALVSRVSNLGERLEAALPVHPFNYQFFVIDDPTPNAFTIPSGKIYVHTGLLKFVDNESQLVGVLAHEIGHMYERHPAKNLSRAYGLENLAGLVFKSNPKAIQSIVFQLAGTSILTRYSREDELEADMVGYHLLKRAGYPVDGLRSFLAKLSTLQGSGQSFPFMSTHPPTAERVRRLNDLEQTYSPG